MSTSTNNKIAGPNPDIDDNKAEIVESDSIFDKIKYMFMHSKLTALGAIAIVMFIVIAVFADFIAPHDPYAMDLRNRLKPPSSEHLLGTDANGRDVLSRIIYGSRVSLAIGLIPTAISMTIGTILGLMAGFMGKKVDFIIMRVADVVLAFPSLLLAMVIMYTLGANLLNLFIALSIISWAQTARIVRSQTLALKEKEFVEAAESIGVKKWVIMIRHILPNCLSSLIVIFTLDVPDAILSEASLSFLGVGAKPPTASWGLMVTQDKQFLFSNPIVAIAPGIAILIVVLAFNFLGDGLRDAIDPYMQE